MTGRNISCPVAAAAVRMPITRPRRATNHRLAMVAAKTMAIEPVPSPISSPQVSTSCQPWVTKMVNPLPAATRSSAKLVTWRMPKRSIRAAANGAIRPYRIRLTLTALDIRVRGQPNSSSSGTISTPGRGPETCGADQGDERDHGHRPGRVDPVRSASGSAWLRSPRRACHERAKGRLAIPGRLHRIPASPQHRADLARVLAAAIRHDLRRSWRATCESSRDTA